MAVHVRRISSFRQVLIADVDSDCCNTVLEGGIDLHQVSLQHMASLIENNTQSVAEYHGLLDGRRTTPLLS